jgi:uncharacterized membrane protein
MIRYQSFLNPFFWPMPLFQLVSATLNYNESKFKVFGGFSRRRAGRGGCQQSSIMTVGLFTLVVAFGVLFPTASAQAALVFCNHTKAPLEAAVAYRDEDEWVSEGWWRIEPGLCVRTFNKPLTQRFYYYYARSLGKPPVEGKGPVTWEGKDPFCIDDKAFLITGDEPCEKRHYRTQGFHKIDLGTNVRDYTLNF